MKINKLTIDCMPGYENSPIFKLHLDNYDELKPVDRLFVEDDGKIWDVSFYECGFVSFAVYFMNNMHEREPYGGAFSNEFGMYNGWSSNEMSFNTLGLLDTVTDVTAIFDGNHRIHLHIGLKELQEQLEKDNLPYTIVNTAYGYIPVPDMDRAKVFECTGSLYVRGESIFDRGTYVEQSGLVFAVDESHAKDKAYRELGFSMSKPVSVIEA